MSPFAREFLFLVSELRRYEACHLLACSDDTAYWLHFRVRQDAELLIAYSCWPHVSAQFGRPAVGACKGVDRAELAMHEAAFLQADPAPGFCQAGVVAPPDSLKNETFLVLSTI